MKNSPFDVAPEFYEMDGRKNRWAAPVTKELLENKHKALLTPAMLKNKTVLDLGSFLGASGNWCLHHKARKYVGVEVMRSMAEHSIGLLHKYHEHAEWEIYNQGLEYFIENNTEQFDIVLLLGSFQSLDYYRLIQKISAFTKEQIIFENNNPTFCYTNEVRNLPFVQMNPEAKFSLPDGKSGVKGFGALFTPSALTLIMESFGFENIDGEISIPYSLGDKDYFNQPEANNTSKRYCIRYYRTNRKIKKLVDTFESQDKDYVFSNRNVPTEKWDFLKSRVDEFAWIARSSIPNYHEVIVKCADVIKKLHPNRNRKIIDIGSSIGTMIKLLYKYGYHDLVGVDSSEDMIRHSPKDIGQFIHSDRFPTNQGMASVVLLNWTLHFIEEKETYLKEIYKYLHDDGVLIISDKVTTDESITDLYYDIKRSHGLSEEEIQTKKQELEGYMFTKPIEWYFVTLYNLGFKRIDIIDASYSFVTIVARK